MSLALEQLADPRIARSLPAKDHAYIAWQIAWYNTARDAQIPPDPETQERWLERIASSVVTSDATPWRELGYMAGRGFGKTRVGAEWLGRVSWECTEQLPRCVVAPTQADVRLTCFEGESGLLNVIPAECRGEYNRGDIILRLNNGTSIRGFSAEKPDRLRGPEHADAWLDEIAAWGKDAPDVYDMMRFGLRLGDNPHIVWTSTPKPVEIVRRLTMPKPGRIVVRGSTYDNAANLAETFLDDLKVYEGTKLGRQEVHGELLDPEEAGIIKRSWFKLWPHGQHLPALELIIMSLDTAYTERTLDKAGDPDPTACGVWGVFRHKGMTHVMLLDCWEDHLGIMDLMRRVKKEMLCRYGDDDEVATIRPLIGSSRLATSGRPPDMLLIEDKGSGISLRQMLNEAGIEAHAYNPGRADKLTRLHIVSPLFANSRVWVPESGKTPGQPVSWAGGLISQLCTFAGEGSIRHDDHVDQTTQALRVAMDMGLLRLVKDKPRLPEDVEREREGRVAPANPYAQ